MDRGLRVRGLFIDDDYAEEYDALPRTARRVLRLLAQHAEGDGIARLTQAEAGERLGLARYGVQEGVSALVRAGFISQVGAGRIWVNDQKVSSFFRRRPPPLANPELQASIEAAAETARKKHAAGRAAYYRRHPREGDVVIDPADVPDWPRPDA